MKTRKEKIKRIVRLRLTTISVITAVMTFSSIGAFGFCQIESADSKAAHKDVVHAEYEINRLQKEAATLTAEIQTLTTHVHASNQELERSEEAIKKMSHAFMDNEKLLINFIDATEKLTNTIEPNALNLYRVEEFSEVFKTAFELYSDRENSSSNTQAIENLKEEFLALKEYYLKLQVSMTPSLRALETQLVSLINQFEEIILNPELSKNQSERKSWVFGEAQRYYQMRVNRDAMGITLSEKHVTHQNVINALNFWKQQLPIRKEKSRVASEAYNQCDLERQMQRIRNIYN